MFQKGKKAWKFTNILIFSLLIPKIVSHKLPDSINEHSDLNLARQLHHSDFNYEISHIHPAKLY